MRVLRVIYNGHTFYASLQEDQLYCLNKNLGLNEPIPLANVSVVPPVMPTKIVCVGMNYHDHAAELGKEAPDEPLIFLKPPSAVIGTGQAIVLPAVSQQVDYEAELAMVIGKSCKDVAPRDVPGHVFGYTCANDVTARDLQQKDTLFARAKGFDTFCPVGPWIETEVEDPANLSIRARIGDRVVQEGNTSDMITKPFELISYISSVMTLLPGDVVLTGTPAGIGPLAAGDEIRVEIDNVGVLINTVVEAPEPEDDVDDDPSPDASSASENGQTPLQ